MSKSSSPNKSTNVRVIQAAAQVPWLGDLLLSELFITAPPRRATRLQEAAVLASAHRGFLSAYGHKLRSYRWGKGPTILLVHGHGGSAAQLTPWVEPLLEKGFSVLAYDAPGHGESSGRHATLLSMAGALHDVLAQVGPVHAVMTHSLGGAAACLAAKRGAPIERAVLIAPPSDVRHWYRRFVEGMALTPAQAARVQMEIERRLKTPLHDLQADALGPHLQAETLVIHDRDDKEVSIESGKHVVRSIPNAELVTTTGLGHRRIVEDPQVIAQAVSFATQGARLTDSLERLIDVELFHPMLRAQLASA